MALLAITPKGRLTSHHLQLSDAIGLDLPGRLPLFRIQVILGLLEREGALEDEELLDRIEELKKKQDLNIGDTLFPPGSGKSTLRGLIESGDIEIIDSDKEL